MKTLSIKSQSETVETPNMSASLAAIEADINDGATGETKLAAAEFSEEASEDCNDSCEEC